MTEEPVNLALEGHPLPAKLSAYHAGELSTEEDDAIQEHLISCDLCREVLLDLERFLNPAEEDLPREGVADLGAAAEWRELRRKIREEPKQPGERAARARPLRRFFASAKTAYALAAVFAAVAVGLSLQVRSLRHDLRASDLNPQSVFLPAGIVRGVDERPKLLSLPRGEDGRVILSLELPPGRPDRAYRVEIRRKGSRSVRHWSGLIPQDREVVFIAPAEQFKSGTYEITLQGLESPEANPPTYELEIVRK